jgi:DNA-binding transcriptional LysR family regulator
LQDIRRLFTVLEQARENAKAVAAGLRGSLRIAVSDGAIDPRLSAFLARCRAEEPEIEIRLSEVPLAEQLRGLRSGDFTIGFAHTADVGDGIVAEPIWRDPLVIAVPARHALLVHKEVPLHELRGHPLVLCDPHACEGYCRELARLLQVLEHKLNVVEEVSSLDMMLTLVGAGYGVGFMTATKIPVCQRPDVVIRPLAMDSAVITTYLLRPKAAVCRLRWSDLSLAYATVRATDGACRAAISRSVLGTKIAFGCSHQFGRTYPERRGNFQYQRQRGHVLPTLDLAHVRARDASPRRELVLSDSLSHAGSTHRLSEGQRRLGFIRGCARRAAWLNG